MEIPTYQRRYEELQRLGLRLKSLKNRIMNNQDDGDDSFGSPKDIALSVFRVNYELKETLKNEDSISEKIRGAVEGYCISQENLALVLDIANAKKHLKLDKPHLRKTTKIIGEINTHVSMFPSGTRVTIMVDGNKIDCLDLCEQTLKSWENFFLIHKISPTQG